MSWRHVDWCMFLIHLRSLNDYHFRVVEATGLEIVELNSTSTHDLLTDFYKNLIQSWFEGSL
jgi:hypothetical protein